MKTNILVLAAGHQNHSDTESEYPVCLSEFDGRALIERLVDNTRRISSAAYTFALRKEEVERYHLDKVVELIAPNSRVVKIPKATRGSACTALLAASQFPSEEEVLVLSANELVDINLADTVDSFRAQGLDGGGLTFRSFHPRYSYFRLDDAGNVVEAAQKNPISLHATTGVFWFARAGNFVEAIKNMIRKNACIDGDFYIAPAFNEIILKQGRVGVQEIDPKKYHPLKNERQINQFEQVNG